MKIVFQTDIIYKKKHYKLGDVLEVQEKDFKKLKSYAIEQKVVEVIEEKQDEEEVQDLEDLDATDKQDLDAVDKQEQLLGADEGESLQN